MAGERDESDGRRSVTAPILAPILAEPPDGILRRVSDHLYLNPSLLLGLLLVPPLLWIGIVYVGSLIALLIQSFYSVDEFSGMVKQELTLATYAELLRPANIDIIVRSVLMAAAVAAAAALIAFPIAYYAARYATGGMKALYYVA